MNDHNKAVKQFFQKCQETNPQQYEEVCQKYPVLTGRQWRTIREREETGYGLIGLQPTRLDPETAAKHNLESAYDKGD